MNAINQLKKEKRLMHEYKYPSNDKQGNDDEWINELNEFTEKLLVNYVINLWVNKRVNKFFHE